MLVVFGVALATTPHSRGKSSSSSPYSASVSGVLLTLLGAFLASVKSVAASALQKDKSPPGRGGGGGEGGSAGIGLGLSAVQLIHYISPLALLQSLLYAWIAGELNHIPSSLFWNLHTKAKAEEDDQGSTFENGLAVLLLINCLIAFGLNIASFEANRRVGALGITIAGNLKQALIVVMGAMGGGERCTGLTLVGVLGTVAGSCWFVVEQGRGERAGGKVEEKDESRELEEGGSIG